MEVAVQIFLGYVMAGLVFSIAFASKGVNVIDPASHRGSIWFRLLLVPGSVALWPVLLVKWIKASKG